MENKKEISRRKFIFDTVKGTVGTLGGAGIISSCFSSNKIKQVLSRMTLEEKVGMLLMAPLNETTIESHLKNYHCGSLIAWRNVSTPVNNIEELCALTNKAQALSLKYRSLPIWLHGYVPELLGWEPGWVRNAVQKKISPKEVEQMAAIFGQRWRAVGLHNLPEPTLNVHIHPTGIMPNWAISRNPNIVKSYGLAVTKGILSANCGTMAQHFPAHGATPLDSHNAYPVVDLPMDELWQDHLACYQACFDAGCTSICTAHLACLSIDPDPQQIATTSKAILTDFLREKMKFKGIVIADAIEMYGFQKNGPFEKVVIDAVIAGCDSLCICGTDDLSPIFKNLLNAAKEGIIPLERLDEAVTRNLSFMEWLGLFERQKVSAEDATRLLLNKIDNTFLERVIA
jgi:beta-N-acetylhexosaminidase